MKRILFSFLLALAVSSAFAQSVPFPTTPRDNNQLEPWGYQQVGTNWDTSPFLPFIYQNRWLRLMPPNGVTYNASTKTWNNSSPSQKYPLILFFHGLGEKGTDNNNQLKHGGQIHRDAVNSGKFPGFLVYPQSTTPAEARNLIEKLISILPIDYNRIYVHGLSNGGGDAWDFAINYPTLVAAAFPMSSTKETAKTTNLLYTPLRQSQGSLDTNPTPGWSQSIVDWYVANGGHLEYFYLQNVGHSTWNTMYNRTDFFPWFLQQKKNKIMVRYDYSEVCPEDPISVDLGFSPGFTSYEWRKDGVLMAGVNTHKIVVNSFGVYTGRILNRGVWTDWSDPVEVKIKQPTETPTIQTNGIRSIVLPALDGSTTTELMLPAGYEQYTWKNATNQTVNTTSVFSNVGVGSYTATVKEQYGCSSIPSPVFNVISANGPNKPDPITSLQGYAPSETQVLLSWNDNPSPQYNETGFEIYRSASQSGPFRIIAISPADAISYTDNGLLANTTYYYRLRPVNNFSAGQASDIIGVLTKVDNVAPTAPSNLTVTNTTPSSVSLSWTASTDNVGVYRYDIYRDGVKVLATMSSSATIYNLTENEIYKFTVKARDLTGNVSVESNMVVAQARLSGLEYKYYESASAWSTLPNFNNLTPVKTGFSSNVDLSVRSRDTNYGIMWSGMIYIPVAGNYTFETYSDDGSKLYIGSYSESNLIVNNDGSHGMQYREGTKNFAAPGFYPIVITYFQGGGGFGMQVFWKNTAHGTVSRTLIPNSAFAPPIALPGLPPNAPTGLTAATVSFDKIQLSWVDNSTNETGFKIYRSLSNTGPFVPVATVSGNTSTYLDTKLNASTRYYYRVTAIGVNGESELSNEVGRGLKYNYYEGIISTVSQINNLSSLKTGYSSSFDVNLRERNQNFALKWVGRMYLNTTATYTFFTSSDDGSALYINDILVVSNDFNQSQRERSGTIALSAGWHNIEVRWRKATSSNSRLTVAYSRPGMSKTTISTSNSSALFYGTEINALTSPLPPLPATPTNLATSNVTPSTLTLSWQDNATDETGYEVWRSFKTNLNYVLHKSLPAGTTSIVESGLFSNTNYFYIVKAIAPGGISSSVPFQAVSGNTVPVLTAIADFGLKFNTANTVNVISEDADNDAISLSVTNLPVFANFVDHGDGTGAIQFNPLLSHLGDYEISVSAQDGFGGVTTESFVLTVTDKDIPVLSPTNSNLSVEEGKSGTIVLAATSDFGAANLLWTFDSLPEFVNYTLSGGVCSFTVSPGFGHSGEYTVNVTVTDAAQNAVHGIVNISVADVDPNYKISVNMVNSSNGAVPWNNMNSRIATSLKDNGGNTTSVGVEFLTTAWNTFVDGVTTGNNSGVFPDNVLRDYYYFGIFGAPETVDMRLSGLDPLRRYNLAFLASSKWTGVADNGSTVFTINGVQSIVRAQGNTQNLAHHRGVIPNGDGTITVRMSKAAGTPVGYLNAFTIESIYEYGTEPIAPRNLSAAILNEKVTLNWVDAPFNEDGFYIYRSESESGPFELLTSSVISANSTSFVDNNVVDGQTYFYKATAYNAFGESDFTGVVSITTPDVAPTITLDGSLVIQPDRFSMIYVSTAADAFLDFQDLPSFAYASMITENAFDLIFTPTAQDAGSYQFSVTATDVLGLTETQTYTLVVEESLLYSIKVNFSQNSAGAVPWNNTGKIPAVNDLFSNLRDQNNASTTVSLRLLTAFGGVLSQGMTTGNNSGIVPDNVLREYYWFGFNGAPTEVSMRVSGLSRANKYSFKFVASSVWTNNGTLTDNGSTVFTIGSKTASVNVQSNVDKLAVIKDVITNSNGEIVIRISKGADALAGFINAMIIEATPVDPSQFVPTNLSASGYSENQIQLTWNDNSPLETGYEIYRSTTGQEGSFSLVATTGVDISSYIDTAPIAKRIYFYKVRALSADGPSEFTNVASSSSINFKVYINVNGVAAYDAPAPWNNLSRFGLTGDIFQGFKDQNGLNTGFRMRVEEELDGGNDWGVSTGNNSGIFPDNVLKSFWFRDAYNPAGVFVIDGLDQTYKYNFGFLGSIDLPQTVRTDFTINSVTVTNNNSRNISSVSYIRNVIPTGNSEVTFSVKEASGSPWSIFNAFVIEAYATADPNPNARRGTTPVVAGNLRDVRFGLAANDAVIYPNPVEGRVNVRTEDSSLGDITYSVIDLMGKTVKNGKDKIEFVSSDFSFDAELQPGVYNLRLVYPDGHVVVRKFIKR